MQSRGKSQLWPNPNQRARGIAQLILACVAVQLAFWLLINPLLFASPKRPDLVSVDSAAMATVQNLDPTGFETARFK